jgi:hypothetical protein
MRRLALLAVALAGLLGRADVAVASCAPLSLQEQARMADVVVSATVGDDLQRIPYPRELTIRVSRVFKGAIGALARVRIGPEIPNAGPFTSGATSVDYRAEPGEHVLYLRLAGGAYETSSCSGSHAGEPTEDERALFGDGQPPARATLLDELAALGVLPLAIAVALVVAAPLVVVRLRPHARRGA